MPDESEKDNSLHNALEANEHAGKESTEESKKNVLGKKPRALPRTPEQRALDKAIAEQTKANERVEAAKSKVAASQRQRTFSVTWQVIHSGVLTADPAIRDTFLAACNELLSGTRRSAFIEYRKAVTAEVAASTAGADGAAAEAGVQKKGSS